MNRSAQRVGNLEPRYNFTIIIELSTGETKTVNKLAVSKYHAIELAYSENIQGPGPYQYDRTKYKLKEPLFKFK